jgi:hypothetical protein
VDGSGTEDELRPTTELLAERPASSLPPLLKRAELMLSAPKRSLLASEPAKPSPLGSLSGLPEASLAAIVRRPRLPAVPPMRSAV